MGDNRISIYAGRPLQVVLEGHDNRSARINAVAERYLYILDSDGLAFTQPEWMALCHALRGYCDDSNRSQNLRLAWAEIEQADTQGDLNPQWDIDSAALAKRLRQATAGQLVATIETVQRFWQHAHLPPEHAIMLAGARITP